MSTCWDFEWQFRCCSRMPGGGHHLFHLFLIGPPMWKVVALQSPVPWTQKRKKKKREVEIIFWIFLTFWGNLKSPNENVKHYIAETLLWHEPEELTQCRGKTCPSRHQKQSEFEEMEGASRYNLSPVPRTSVVRISQMIASVYRKTERVHHHFDETRILSC